MNIRQALKSALAATLGLAACLSASAQSQGYKDGIEYYKAGQYKNAEDILNRTYGNADTDKSMANYYLGQTELALNKNKTKALEYFKKGLDLDQANPYNYVGIGAVDLLNGNEASARDYFKEAQKLAKKDAQVTTDIARAFYNADQVKYAKDIEKNITKALKDSKNQEPSIFILEGDMDVDAEKYGEAAGYYEQAITADPNNPEGYVKFANSYFRINPQLAIQKLEQFLQQSPNSALAQRELAEKYYEANHWNKASDLYGDYIKNPNHFPEDKARYAVLLYYGKDYPKSLSTAEEVLAITPNNFVMQRLLFLNKAEMEGMEQAAADEAARFFGNNPDAQFTTKDYTTYSTVLSNLGQDSLALVQFELAVKGDPDNKDLLRDLSSKYNAAKRYGEAADTYANYIAKLEDPSANDYFNAAGRYLNAAATAGDNQELRESASMKGIEMMKKSMSEAQANPALQQRLARLYMTSNGNKPNQEAVDTYLQMIALLDQDPSNMTLDKKDSLAMYREGYQFITYYYTSIAENPEKKAEFLAKFKTVNDMLNGGAQQ